MNKHILFAGYIVASLLLPLLAYGDVYQWVDEKGQVHFGNVPPRQQGPYKLGGYGHDSTRPVSTSNEPSKSQTDSSTQQVPVQQKLPRADSVSVVAEPEKTVATATPVVSPVPGSVKPTLDAKPKAVVNPLELDDLIERLRNEAKAPQSPSVASPTEPAVHKIEVQKPQVQKPKSQKTGVHKANAQEAVKTQKPVGIVVPVAAQVKIKEKKNNTEKEKPDAAVIEVDKTSEEPASDLNDEKDAGKCGVFTDFVTSYEAKVKDGCPGAHCSVYKRSLKKYKLKEERYCQP